MIKKGFWNFDLGLLTPVLILVFLSLSTLFSINFTLFKTQFIFFIICLFLFVIFSQINFNLFEFYSLPTYIASIVILAIVLLMGIESRGSVRWVELLGVRIQFSEILKPFLAVSFASYLSGITIYSLKNFIKAIVLILPISFLIFVQPDLGNALLYILVAVFSLFFFGFPLRFFIAGMLVTLSSIPFFWNFLHDYQRQRVLTFFNPARDPLGTSYNAIQAVITVGSGMILGKGLGQGTQSGLSFLPEQHTDFIYATLSEDLGFVGGILILGAFSFLLYRIFSIYLNSENKFHKIFAAVSFFVILIQFFVNSAMNIGLLPIVGVTLPFVSYGGSSLLSNFILLGLLSSISRKSKEDKVIEIR